MARNFYIHGRLVLNSTNIITSYISIYRYSIVPVERRNCLYNVYNMDVKIFYGKCSNTFVSRQFGVRISAIIENAILWKRVEGGRNNEENERRELDANTDKLVTGFLQSKFACPSFVLVSLITCKWSCGRNEPTDRLLQNFSTSKHARCRNIIRPIPTHHNPLSTPVRFPLVSLRVASLFFFIHPPSFASNLLCATSNFPRPRANDFFEQVFIRSNFAAGVTASNALYFLVTILSISSRNSISGSW